jgi:hypothetical protein
LFKGVAPDGYGASPFLAGRPCTCCPSLTVRPSRRKRLRQKAVGYAQQIPRSELGEYDTFVILAVPTATRAKLAREAVADTGAPIVVVEWSKASTCSTLTIVTDAADQIAARRSA